MSCDEAVQLSLILPAFNEGPAVVEAVERHVACLSKLEISYEIVIVNDGSSDNTPELSQEAVKRFCGVRVLTNPRNRGQAASILRGFLESHGRVVMHNGMDMPFHPSDIERVWNEISLGADVVVVERRNREAYGWFRKVTSWCNIALVKLLFESPFVDHNFVQAYSRRVIDSIVVESAGVSTVTTELILKALRLGYRVRCLEADYRPRRRGQSTISGKKIVRTIIELLKLYRIMRTFAKGTVPVRDRERRTKGPSLSRESP